MSFKQQKNISQSTAKIRPLHPTSWRVPSRGHYITNPNTPLFSGEILQTYPYFRIVSSPPQKKSGGYTHLLMSLDRHTPSNPSIRPRHAGARVPRNARRWCQHLPWRSPPHVAPAPQSSNGSPALLLDEPSCGVKVNRRKGSHFGLKSGRVVIKIMINMMIYFPIEMIIQSHWWDDSASIQ